VESYYSSYFLFSFNLFVNYLIFSFISCFYSSLGGATTYSTKGF
jgi:hypothetical protein